MSQVLWTCRWYAGHIPRQFGPDSSGVVEWKRNNSPDDKLWVQSLGIDCRFSYRSVGDMTVGPVS